MDRTIDRRDFLKGAVVLGAGLAVLPRLARSEPAGAGKWLAGDLHCHTVYSHDVYWPTEQDADPAEIYTFGWFPAEQILNAETRGLDFLAITDHNELAALTDAGYASDALTLIPGFEKSMSGGHAGVLGIADLDVLRSLVGMSTSGDDGAIAFADAVRAAGGTFILNHPNYGDGWRYSPRVRPDSIEVWNIGWPYRHVGDTDIPPAPSVSDNYKSLPFWEGYLAGGPMPVNGGSDNHYRATAAAQGVGQPTTWVYAADDSYASILEAIRAGRTTVSAQPPALGGAQLFLTATDGSTEWIVGDYVPATAGTIEVTARIVGAPGNSLRFVVDGVNREPRSVAGPDASVSMIVNAGEVNRVRAEVYIDEGYYMTALSSPIYFG